MSGPTRPDAGTGNAFHGKRTIKKDLTVPWVATQHRTFTRWSNIFLAQHPTSPTTINGLVNPNDLHTGLNLILLLEALSGKEILKNSAERKAAMKPSRFQYLDNATKALNFVRQEGIRLVNIGSTDIVDSNLTPTLGLMWSLILHYQITSSVEPSAGGPSTGGAPAKDEEKKTAAKQELLNWVNSKIEPLGGPHVNNFGRDWNNGVALCALNEALAPGSMGEDNVANAKKRATTDDGKKQNGKLALDTAVNELEIPKLLDVDDLITNDPDELSVMTLVGVYRMAEGKPKGEKMKTIRPNKKNKDASPPAPVVVDDGEAKRKEAEEAERKRKEVEEAERKRKEAEDAERRRREAEEADRKKREAEDVERRRKEAEEADRRRRDSEEVERKRREAEEADRKRRAAEDAAAAAERKRREAEEAAAAAERRRREEEDALKAVAEERRRKEEEKRKQDEEDAKRRRLEDEEAMRRRREDEERALREKREREEAELKRKREEEDRRRKEEDDRRKYDEEERKRREDEAKRKRDEEDRKRQEEEDRRKREEDEKRRKDDDELRRRREDEEEARRKRRDEEEAERIRRRTEEEAERKRREEEDATKRKRDEEARKKQAEVEAEARRREEEEEKEARRKKNEEKRKKAAEAEAKRLKELEEAANKKSDNEHSDDDNSSEEGGGTHIFSAPVSDGSDATPDKFKNRRGGCFVCEVNKPYGRKQGSLLMRGYLPNHPFYPGGNIEIETEILQEAKDARIMTDAGREMKVWIETTHGVFGKRQVSQLEDKELRPMGLDIFRDARFTWKLPDDLELTKGKKGKIKHSLCMDIISNDKKKVLKFRWPVEEVSNSKSVIHKNTGAGKSSEPPKAGSVGALLAERKAGSSSSTSSPAMGKPAPLVKPALAKESEGSSNESSESSGTSSGDRRKKRSGSSGTGSSDSRESSAESSDTSSGTESD